MNLPLTSWVDMTPTLLIVALWAVCLAAGAVFYAVPTLVARRRRRRGGAR